MVRNHEQTDSSNACKNANYLRKLIADMKEDEGYDDDDYDCPKIDELRG